MNSKPQYINHPESFKGIPDYMIGGLRRYIENGIPPGSFLTAVLSNDLMGAFAKADSTNTVAMVAYARFLYAYAPHDCHGSPAKVRAWMDKGGLGLLEVYEG